MKIKRIINKFLKEFSGEVNLREWHSSIILEGRVRDWDTVIKAGKMAARYGYKGVVNRLEVRGLVVNDIKKPKLRDNFLDKKKVDVLVIGGGIIGCSILRELSKWELSMLMVDKEADVAMHASSRNDGMIHPGFEPKPGSKKAYFNVRGNELYTQIAKELNAPFVRSGSSVLLGDQISKLAYPVIKARASKNGVIGTTYLNREQLKQIEPNVLNKAIGAVHFNSTALVSPYKMTVAYGENAVQNGAEISLNTIVEGINREKDRIESVDTNRGRIYPRVVIDAAGVFADRIAQLAGDQFFTIHPRKGELVFLDKKAGRLINSVIAMPSISTAKGNTKGGGLIKTVDGNILVGPDAYEQPFKEDYSTNRINIERILTKHLPLIPGLTPKDVISYCAGTRAATYEEDFIVEKSEYVENLVYAAGIQSPGLACAPAIAEKIEGIALTILSEEQRITRKASWNPIRKSIPELNKMSFEERSRLIKTRPDYGIILCRCEEISKGEIIDALKSPIPVQTVDGVKRRVRAGMGRCQGGFCLPLVMEVMAETNNEVINEITKKGNTSMLLMATTKNGENITGGDGSGRQL